MICEKKSSISLLCCSFCLFLLCKLLIFNNMHQLVLFPVDTSSFDIELRPSKTCRRAKTAPIQDDNITCRRDRLAKRNKTLIARYYYWCEIRRRRYDDVLKILEDKEFFVEYQTLNNALTEYNDYYISLINNKVTASELKREYPSFDWSVPTQ